MIACAIAAALGAAVGARAATAPDHRIADGCPLCSGGGPFGPDGLPAYGAGDDLPKTAGGDTSASSPASAGKAPGETRPAPPRVFPKIEKDAAGRAQIGFEHLASFAFAAPSADAAPTPGAVERIPENVRTLDRQRVVLTGYMMPTKLEGGLVRQFFIVRSPLVCCFGQVPAPNEWILVSVAGEGIRAQQDVPLRFTGRLRVGEIYDEGAFVGVYRLELEKVLTP